MSESREGRIAPWAFAGVVVMGLLLFVVWRFGQASSPAQALALKASRVDLVGQMQVALASAAEAEKSAVLAVTDEASTAFADQARAATAELERGRVELGRLLQAGGTPRERELLDQFSAAFTDLRKVDDEVLRLAVKNTNLKASALAFGPAAQALSELDAALVPLAARRAGSPQAAQGQRLADQVRLGTLRVQALLAPHIAEERDDRMDQLEATMNADLGRAQAAMAGLVALAGATEAAPAQAQLERYLELQRQVLALSRENTNVKSLALSLGQKRTTQAVCLEVLAALQQAILEEPIAGVAYGRTGPTR
jgi:hypothetical protein